MLEYSLVSPSLHLANIFHGCWRPIGSPGTPSIWLFSINYQMIEFLPIQSYPKQFGTPHIAPCCLKGNCLLILIIMGEYTYHVKGSISLTNVIHTLPAVWTKKLAIDINYKIQDCDLTMTYVLCCIGDMALNSMHACKQARETLN